MARQPPTQSIAGFLPRPHRLAAQVRRAALDSANVAFGEHALDRMEEREITTLDVLRTLRTGDIDGEITAGKNVGEWKCKIVAPRKGAREVGVVTVVLSTGRLFIKTVEWEDI